MILAKSISAPNGLFSLLEKGEVLTDPIIQKLAVHYVDGIYVEMDGSEDIEPKCLMRPEVKQQIAAEFRSLYSSYFHSPYISRSAVECTKKLQRPLLTMFLTGKNISWIWWKSKTTTITHILTA